MAKSKYRIISKPAAKFDPTLEDMINIPSPDDRTKRLAEISERAEQRQTHHGLEEFHAYTKQLEADRNVLLSELAAFEARARKWAKLMREAMVLVAVSPHTRCPDCAHYIANGASHSEECLITRLRNVADQIEGK